VSWNFKTGKDYSQRYNNNEDDNRSSQQFVLKKDFSNKDIENEAAIKVMEEKDAGDYID
jgi:uncharacterized protein YdbL (DUF1318 family)